MLSARDRGRRIVRQRPRPPALSLSPVRSGDQLTQSYPRSDRLLDNSRDRSRIKQRMRLQLTRKSKAGSTG
jgi:hypothetical protein